MFQRLKIPPCVDTTFDVVILTNGRNLAVFNRANVSRYQDL